MGVVIWMGVRPSSLKIIIFQELIQTSNCMFITMENNLNNARVIVTYGRSLIALMIAQSLGRRGAEIIGCDDVNMTVLSFSKFVSDHHIYASPQKNPTQFIKDLKKIILDNKPDDNRPYVLIPSFYEARLIAKHADEFKNIITLACPSYDSINAIDPKDHLIKTLSDTDIDFPDSWFPQDNDDLKTISEKCDFPVFIKPPDEVGGRGISKVSNADELQVAFQQLKEDYPDKQIIVQELAKGVDYCFCGLFDKGRLITSMVYHNAQKFPNNTGPGVVRETVDLSLFNPIAEQLMTHVKWNGVCEIDFMWTGDNADAPMMIEVNPRFWSGLDHSIKSNLDFPYYLYQLFINGTVDDLDDVNIGHKTTIPILSGLSAAEAFMDNSINFDKLEQQWPSIKDNLNNLKIDKVVSLFQDSLSGSISFGHAYDVFKTMSLEAKKAEKITITDDDPFVGLGALFIIGSLLKHGKLPPEIKR